MFMVNVTDTGIKAGPFGAYANALAYAQARWEERKFYITGNEMETFFTLGIPVDI